MAVEHRAGVSFRVAGRTLSGRALEYGDTANMGAFRERFEPGAFGTVPQTIPINLQHDRAIIIAERAILRDSPRSLEVRADLPAESAALALVRRGALSGFSIEFRAKSERREAGVRVVERASLTGLALVDSGAYPQSTAEVRRATRARSGRRLRSRIPYDKALACECIRAGGSGAECVPIAKFMKVAGEGMTQALNDAIDGARDVLAVAGNYRRPLASASRGTLRATSTAGALEIEIDIPTGTVGDDLVSAHEAAGVVVRPLLDFDRSEFTDGPDGRTITKPFLRAFLVGATDAKEGWPDPDILYTDPERAAPAPAPERRRSWLP